MRRDARAAARREDGSASIEFVALTLVLLVPLLALAVMVTRIQSAAYAAEAAASAASRAAVVAGLDALAEGADDAEALAGAHQDASLAAALVAEDFGWGTSLEVALTCEGACLAPGTSVSARAAVEVPLPGVPSFVQAMVPATLTIEAVASSPVDGYAP
ncbi:hypothetical protein [Demequina subtropica]|uniref:hypothetical protein n=1 Tax=Demequina subtropica TaxID=1638989 RepID=UPI000782FBB1|nr:hypothetical protein [Demequina subtropica]